MEWIRALEEQELREGTRQVVTAGKHSVLLINHGGQVYGIASTCPHMGAQLKGGTVEDDIITCPWHHSRFDLRTGEVVAWVPWPPVLGRVLGALKRRRRLPTYLTKVEDGSIWVGIGDKR